MMDLHEIEELCKTANARHIKLFLESAKTQRDPNASPEDKASAQIQLDRLAEHYRPTPKQAKTKTKTAPAPLDEAIVDAKAKMAAINNKKISQSIAQGQAKLQNAQANDKAEKQAQRQAQRDEERKAQLLPGTNHTQKELQIAADRATRDPNAEKPIDLNQREVTPTQAKNQVKAKQEKTVFSAFDLAHQLHGAGSTDDAHKVLNAIPKEHYPQELKHYNPTYIHYGVSPEMWKQVPDSHDHVHNFHNEVMSGKHDNSDDAATKAMATKVQGLAKPKVA